MKNIFLTTILFLSILNAWEINTHRVIDRTAIESEDVLNLQNFIKNNDLEKENYDNEIFEGYNYTYLNYIRNGEKNGISNWSQEFNVKPSYQKMLEAGSILEDAQWYHQELYYNPMKWQG